MEKYILAINGSPRKGGNSDLLMDSFLRGTRERKDSPDLKIKEIFADKVDVSPCKECNNCTRTGKCIVQDEMQVIFEDLLDCDFIVISSPIFFTTVSGYLKAIIDRCQRFWSLKYEHGEKIVKKQRKGILISTSGSPKADIFDCTKKVIRALFDVLYIDYLKDFTFNGVDKKGDILKREAELKTLHDFGKNGSIFY